MSIKSLAHRNRGMALERLINMTNVQYRNKCIADVRKIPTPVKITKDLGSTVHGRKEKGELVDYLGCYGSKAIAFDAKETKLTSFPLSNITNNQYNFLKSWHENGATCFLIVSMRKFNKIYYLDFKTLKKAFETAENGGRKSIPMDVLETCPEIKSKNGYVLHYIELLGE